MKISVVIPVFNEEANLPMLYQRLVAVLKTCSPQGYELVFVNDGSRDGSLAQLRLLAQTDASVKYIDLSRNFGHQVAVTAGLRACTCHRVVIIDSDLQDPPELIEQLSLKMNEGFDVVYAKRKARAGESWFKRLTAKLFYRLLRQLTPIDIPVDTGDYRIMSRRVVNVLNQMPEHHRFIRGQVAWAGFSQSFVEYDRHERVAGQSGYPFWKMARFAMDGITSFSDFPLRLATWGGFAVSGLSFVLMLYALYSRLVLKVYEPGWTSIMLSVLFLGGIQLIAVGIIGEYVGRISDNVRNRPLYVIKESNFNPNEQDH